MTHALVTYYSHAGHTARIARVICETIREQGAECDLMDIAEASREGVVWEKYDLVIVGAAIIYGVYNKIVWEFIRRYQAKLDARANSFFNVTVVARTPYKATIEGNRYMQRFLQKSSWRPKDLKCIAGKVDYPNWNWYQKLAIQMIMKMTKGPTDPTARSNSSYRLHRLGRCESLRQALLKPCRFEKRSGSLGSSQGRSR